MRVSGNSMAALGALAIAFTGFQAGVVTPARAQEPVPPGLEAPDAPEVPAADSAEDNLEILTKGPVHEAFAELILFEPQEGLVVTKAPPADVEEIPPETKPDGRDVQWIPGYWAWDDERDDFLWISGVYRVPPKGRHWVPGSWSEVDGGYRWTSGFWMSDETQDVSYLPEPPASLENGPTSEAPSEDYFWVPGCWEYQQDDYAWRPGYWSEGHADWVWIPSHYCYHQRGAVYVNGYWDYRRRRSSCIFTAS